jgi:hypothetical protein
MTNNFWKTIFSRAGFVFFICIVAFGILAILRVSVGHEGSGSTFGAMLGVVLLSVVLTAIISVPYAFYLYGRYSRISDPNIKPEGHTAFKDPSNAPASTGPRIIGVGEILEKAWAFYKLNFKKMWPLFLLGGFATIFVAATFPGIIDAIVLLHLNHAVLMTVILVVILILAVFLLLSKIAFFKGLSDTYRGQFAGTKKSYKKSFGLFWPFLLLVLMMWFAWCGSFILLAVPGIILYGYLLFAQVVFVDTDKRNFAALTTSWTLVKTHWWGVILRVIAVTLLIGIMGSIISLAFYLVIALCVALAVLVHALLPVAILIGAAVLIGFFAFAVLVIEPFLIISFFELYYGLVRVRATELAEDAALPGQRKTMLIVAIVIGVLVMVPDIYFGARTASNEFGNIVNGLSVPGSSELYHASAGSFSANFLGQPTVSVQNATSSTGTPFSIYTYQNEVNQNLVFTVTYAQQPSLIKSVDADAVLTSYMDGGASSSDATVVSSQLGTFEGLPSNDYLFYLPNEGAYGLGRTIIDGQNTYSLSAVYPSASSSNAFVEDAYQTYPKLANVFINSFTVDGLSTSTPVTSTSATVSSTSTSNKVI